MRWVVMPAGFATASSPPSSLAIQGARAATSLASGAAKKVGNVAGKVGSGIKKVFSGW